MNITNEAFLDLKQELATKLDAGDIAPADAVEQLAAAGWHRSLAIDFVAVIVNGKGE